MSKQSEPDLETFAALVKRHDLTHEMSDDHGVWRRGRVSLNRIFSMRDILIQIDPKNKEKCREIWNAEVDLKLVEEIRAQFYWKG